MKLCHRCKKTDTFFIRFQTDSPPVFGIFAYGDFIFQKYLQKLLIISLTIMRLLLCSPPTADRLHHMLAHDVLRQTKCNMMTSSRGGRYAGAGGSQSGGNCVNVKPCLELIE